MKAVLLLLLAIPLPVVAKSISPMTAERESLVASPDEVRWYVLERAFPGMRLTFDMFVRMDAGRKDEMTREAFCLATLKNLALLQLDEKGVEILETFDRSNHCHVVESFERHFFRVHGRYPVEAIGVNVESVRSRLMRKNTIR